MTFRARRAGIVGRGLPYLVAAADGEVLGYAYAGSRTPPDRADG